MNRSIDTTGEVFSVVASVPAAQSLRERLEQGEPLSLEPVSPGAQPFLAVFLARLFPNRPVVAVTDGLKTQEIFQQDVETWAAEPSGGETTPNAPPLFYPEWEILPQEARLPHADVVSERLATLAALAAGPDPPVRPIVVANVTALLQKTFPPAELKRRIRHLRRGEALDPLDLIEWLEDQSYEAEAQVTEKGHVAMRGGIVDVWPLSSPWPARLEFAGNELESLRYFDPITQVSREEIAQLAITPGGEIGLLKKEPESPSASLLEYLPRETLFLLCEPDLLAARAQRYQEQVPPGHPLLISWEQFQREISARGMTSLSVGQLDAPLIEDFMIGADLVAKPERLDFQSLEVFRPIGERRPEPHIAEAQRQEFFGQLHRWLRQGYAVHLFCNNDGRTPTLPGNLARIRPGRAGRAANRAWARSPADSSWKRPNWWW